jgi:hypothetical protein
MNAKASHFSANVISWAEHEEAILVSLVRKLRNDVDEIKELLAVIGVVLLLAYVFLSVLPQLDHYTQLSSCSNVLPLFSGIL